MVDVEMVNPRTFIESSRKNDGGQFVGGDDILPDQEVSPAEALHTSTNNIVDHPVVRRQNICFLVALFSSVLGVAIYTVGKIYMHSSAVPIVGGASDKTNKFSLGFGKYANSRGKGWVNIHPNNTGPAVSTDDEKENAQKWLDANVTLDDGIQYQIVKQLHHDRSAFTEGLCFVNGRLFESVGLTGKSDVRELDPDTGDVIQNFPMHDRVFGEGLSPIGDGTLIQLTWKSKRGYKYNMDDLSTPIEEFRFDATRHEGWGLTYDAEADELIESDGSSYLHFWDPSTMKQKRKVKVTRMDGSDAKQINELEFWRGRVLANLWYKDIIIVINPLTGVVEKEYDFKQLWKKNERRKAGADVLNGISVSADPSIIYVTGKDWDRMFKLRLLP